MGVDKLDLSALFRAAGYTGFDHDGTGPSPVWPNRIIDLENVAPSQVSAADWIIH